MVMGFWMKMKPDLDSIDTSQRITQAFRGHDDVLSPVTPGAKIYEFHENLG